MGLFAPRLHDKIAELRTAAIQNYVARYPITFDGAGQAVYDPEHYLDQWPPLPEELQESEPDALNHYYAFMESLDSLTARLEHYEDLGDSLDLTVIVVRLDREWSTQVDWDDPDLDLSAVIERDVATDAPSNVHDRLQFAYFHWVRPIEAMIVAEMWSGDGASQFQDEFIEPFQTAKSMQAECVKVLAAAAEAARRGVVGIQHDLMAISDACIARLTGQDTPDAAQVLGGLSLGTSVIGLFFPPADLLSLGLGIAAIFAEEASADEPPEPWTIEGTEATTFIHSMSQVVTRMESAYAALDERIGRALERAVDSPNGFLNPAMWVRRPDVADDPGAFGERYGEPGNNPDSLEFRLVTVRIPQLYEAGQQKLPAAAEQYDEAVTAVRAAVLPGWLATYFGNIATHFEDARVLVTSRLEETRDNLTDTGEALTQVAEDYELTDEENATVLREIEQILPPEDYLESEEYRDELASQGLPVEPGWSHDYTSSSPPAPHGGESVYF